MSQSVTVFVSYSHDSLEHDQRVLSLANRLRQDGIDAVIDQYEQAPPEGWPKWMDRHLREADYVLVVCTETYNQRASGQQSLSKGHGVRWESTLAYQYIYDDASMNRRFIPVLLSSPDKAHIPMPLRATTYYDLSGDEGYERLYRRLTDQPAVVKVPLGTIRKFPQGGNPTPATHPSTANPTSAPTANPPREPSGAVAYERPVLRNLLVAVLVTDSDLDAFCLDYFPNVYRLFSSGMDRMKKISLLLEHVDADSSPEQLVKYLQQMSPQRFAKHKHLLGNRS